MDGYRQSIASQLDALRPKVHKTADRIIRERCHTVESAEGIDSGTLAQHVVWALGRIAWLTSEVHPVHELCGEVADRVNGVLRCPGCGETRPTPPHSRCAEC